MTQCSVSARFGPPSRVSPVTLNNLPRVSVPTGTLIPDPVGTTSISLDKPSLAASMMHLTVLFPMCCAASIMHFFP